MKQNKSAKSIKAFALSGIMLASCLIPALQTFDVSAEGFEEAGVIGPAYSENLVVGGGTYENVLADDETERAVGASSASSVSGAWSYSGSAAIVKDGDNTVFSTRTAKGWSYAAQAFESQGVGNYLVSFDYYNPTGAANGYLYFLYFKDEIQWKNLEMFGDYDSTEQNIFTAPGWLNFNAGTAIAEKTGWYHFEQVIGIPRDGYSDICFASYGATATNYLYVDNVSVKFEYPREEYSENLVAGGGTFEGVLTDDITTADTGKAYTDTIAGVWTNPNWTDSPAVISKDPMDSTNSVVKLSYTDAGKYSHVLFNFNNKGKGTYLFEFDYYNGITPDGNIGRIWSNFGKSKATESMDEDGNVIGSIVNTTEETWMEYQYDLTTWMSDAPNKSYHTSDASLNVVSNPTYNMHSGNPIQEKDGWIHFKQYIELDDTMDCDIFRIWAHVGSVSDNQVLIDNVSLRAVYPACEDDTYLDWSANIGHSVSFHNDLTMNYYVPENDLAYYDSYYLSIEKAIWNEDGTWGKETVQLNGTLTDNGYKFVFENIAAAEAGNTLKATLYAEKDGVIYKSFMDTYSVKAYAYNRLENSDDEAFKTLLVDMLNYCSAAQTYFGVNTDNLVNADLTAEQQALATTDDAALQGMSSTVALDGASAQIVGKSIVFNSNIEMKLYMDLSAYDNLTGITLSATYVDVLGETHSITKTASEFGYASDVNCYTVKIDELCVADMRQEITLVIQKDGVAISDTVIYSVETYVYTRLDKSTNEQFKALVKELMQYADSAKNYFA